MESEVQKRMFYNAKDGYILGLIGVLTPVIVSVAIIILMLFVAIGAGSGYEDLYQSPVFVYATQFLCEIAFVFSVILYNKYAKVSFKSASFIKTKPKYFNIALALIIGIALPIFWNPLISMWEMLLKSLGLKIYGLGVPFDTGIDLTLCILFLGIVPAVCEEIFFRGALLNSLREKGVWFAVLYSTMCFSLMHAGLQQLPYTFILGFTIGVIVFYTKSIWLGMLAHACNNITVLILGFISRNETPPATVGWADVVYAVLMALVGLALIVATFVFAKKYNKPAEVTLENPMKAQAQTEKKKDVATIMLVALTIVCAVAMIIIRGIS